MRIIDVSGHGRLQQQYTTLRHQFISATPAPLDSSAGVIA